MVTTDELKDLAYLPGEISYIDRQIKSLKCPPFLKDMRTAQREECTAALTELIELYQDRRQKCAAQLEKLRAFMDSIGDTFTRELFRLHYGCALEWRDVNIVITEKRGLWYEDSSLRQICRRYLERYNSNEQDQNDE